jgi:hypothetical protein
MTGRRDTAADALLHPVVLLALAVWLVNDHWAKAALPGAVTGKLSDVAGLIVFPLLPAAALALWRQRRGGAQPGPAWAPAWIIATAAAMTAIKLLDPAAWLYRHGLAAAQWPLRAAYRLITTGDVPALGAAQLTMDPFDLAALPALVVPWMLLRRARMAGRLQVAAPEGHDPEHRGHQHDEETAGEGEPPARRAQPEERQHAPGRLVAPHPASTFGPTLRGHDSEIHRPDRFEHEARSRPASGRQKCARALRVSFRQVARRSRSPRR